jgi:hypothetical protein
VGSARWGSGKYSVDVGRANSAAQPIDRSKETPGKTPSNHTHSVALETRNSFLAGLAPKMTVVHFKLEDPLAIVRQLRSIPKVVHRRTEKRSLLTTMKDDSGIATAPCHSRDFPDACFEIDYVLEDVVRKDEVEFETTEWQLQSFET